MIWIITASIFYTIIALAALVLICEKDRDSYWDLRNIVVAFFWWLVLIWLGIVWVAHRISYKKEVKDAGN